MLEMVKTQTKSMIILFEICTCSVGGGRDEKLCVEELPGQQPGRHLPHPLTVLPTPHHLPLELLADPQAEACLPRLDAFVNGYVSGSEGSKGLYIYNISTTNSAYRYMLASK